MEYNMDKVKNKVIIWSIDGFNNYGTLHVVYKKDEKKIKDLIKNELKEHGINHITVEMEKVNEMCNEEICSVNLNKLKESHSHHHNH